MKTTISSRGQVVLPAELRELDQIQPGEQFSIERLDAGQYLLRRMLPANAGLVDWLRACPEADWFEALPSESTDSL